LQEFSLFQSALVREVHHSLKLWTFSPLSFSPWFNPRGRFSAKSIGFQPIVV
jgi:hypothetical protein